MVADSDFKRGRFDEVRNPTRVAADTIEDPALWFALLYREVLAAQVPQRGRCPHDGAARRRVAENQETDFDEQVRLAKQAVGAGGTVNSAVPVCDRVGPPMGYLFLQEGGRGGGGVLQSAIASTKGGANKAAKGWPRLLGPG
jgi:hypothetical protein